MSSNGIGDVLAIARKAMGLTQAEVGEAVGVTQVAILRYEAGDRDPDDALVEKLASVLGITPALLRHGGKFRGALAVDAHMRRQKSTKASLWRRMEARLNLLRIHSSFLFEEVSIRADQSVPTFDSDFIRPADAARMVRAEWRLPIGPVVNLVRWVEAAGCLVFEEDFGTHRIDGLSHWVDDHPIILVNSRATPDRRRLTVAHELGHLVLHSNGPTEDVENDANEFAAEFLMPEAAIRVDLRNRDLGTLLDLKREWGVSMQALFERAYRLGLTQPNERLRFYKQLNARGWKTEEPGNEAIPVERPQLASTIGEALIARGLTRGEAAEVAGYVSLADSPFRPGGFGLRAV